MTNQKVNASITQSKYHSAKLKELIGNNPSHQIYLVELYNYQPAIDSMQSALDEHIQYLGLKQTSAKKIARYQKRENKRIREFEKKYVVIQNIIKRGFTNAHFKQLCFKKSDDNKLEHLVCNISNPAQNQNYIFCTFYEKTTENNVCVYEGGGDYSTVIMPTYQVMVTLKNKQNNTSISIFKETKLKEKESSGRDDGKDKGPSKATAYEAVMEELIERVNMYEFFNNKS